MRTVLSLIVLFLTACAHTGYELLETTSFADEHQTQMIGFYSSIVGCEMAKHNLTKEDIRDIRKGGPNVLVLGRTLRKCKKTM